MKYTTTHAYASVYISTLNYSNIYEFNILCDNQEEYAVNILYIYYMYKLVASEKNAIVCYTYLLLYHRLPYLMG